MVRLPICLPLRLHIWPNASKRSKKREETRFDATQNGRVSTYMLLSPSPLDACDCCECDDCTDVSRELEWCWCWCWGCWCGFCCWRPTAADMCAKSVCPARARANKRLSSCACSPASSYEYEYCSRPSMQFCSSGRPKRASSMPAWLHETSIAAGSSRR